MCSDKMSTISELFHATSISGHLYQFYGLFIIFGVVISFRYPLHGGRFHHNLNHRPHL